MNENNKKNSNNTNKSPIIYMIIISLALTFGLNFLLNAFNTTPCHEIYYNEFIAMVEAGKVESVEVKRGRKAGGYQHSRDVYEYDDCGSTRGILYRKYERPGLDKFSERTWR